jgi:hypothetical protein
MSSRLLLMGIGFRLLPLWGHMVWLLWLHAIEAPLLLLLLLLLMELPLPALLQHPQQLACSCLLLLRTPPWKRRTALEAPKWLLRRCPWPRWWIHAPHRPLLPKP